MQKRNFNQARRQREATRKARQQEKLDRKHSRPEKATTPVSTDEAIGVIDGDTTAKAIP